MRFEFGLYVIDLMRGKRKFRYVPRSRTTDAFREKMSALLKTCAHFRYPEAKGGYEPDFSRPILLEKNPAKVWRDYRRAWRKIEKLGVERLEEAYNLLSDGYSKDMMLMVLAYNCFDEPRLRFPVFYSPSLQKLDDVEACALDDEELSLWGDFVRLKKFDLSRFGYNATLWMNAYGVVIDFIDEQYRYKNLVEASKGDVVIDAGACYGDTAVYFSEKTGGADVYSFEFLPETVDVFKKNVALNPRYRDSVHLVQKPIGDMTGKKLYAVPNGPGTSVGDLEQEGSIMFETVSIDDFVEQNGIAKVDFIKMDVEGSEAAALRGAVRTIRRHKPKLAICAYHKPDDMCILPQLIKSMVPEYRLYLDHFTINSTETVLFAQV